jgi:hypothetical protein
MAVVNLKNIEEYEITGNEDEADVKSARNAFNNTMLAIQKKDSLAAENRRRTVGLYQVTSKAHSSVNDMHDPATSLSKQAAFRQCWEEENNGLHLTIEAIQKKLRSKKKALHASTTKTRHEAALQFIPRGLADTSLDGIINGCKILQEKLLLHM